MRYLISLRVDGSRAADITAEQMAEFMAVHGRIQDDLRASGEFVETSELSMRDARTVSTAGGELLVTDGPFAEGKEFVGGYYVVDCTSLDRACEIAARFVEAQVVPAEVRRIGGDG